MSRVMLLEDDANFRLSLAEVLEDEDYTVYQAGDSQQALACARLTPLDLVVSDVRMAGLDGLATLELLGQLQPELRSIVMTGYADESAPMRAVRAQAWDYLYKPFSREAFLTAVRRVLEEEREGSLYQGLLQRVLKGYQGLLSSAQVLSLERARDRVFQAWFVLVRSRGLSQHEAWLLWEQLSNLEAQRKELKGGVDLGLRQRLAEGYRALGETLGTLAEHPEAVVLPGRPSSPEQRLQFATLYQRLQEGRVSLTQLKLAPLLAQMSALELRDTPELVALAEEMWGRTSLDSR